MSLLIAAVAAALAFQAAPAAKAPEAKAAPQKPLTFTPKTMVDGETLQIVLGQRAVFQLDDKGQPVLLKVEEGKLAAAHPAGAVTETFAPPPEGQIAAALDGSAEKRATVLKIWNRTGKPLDYRAIALVMRKDKLTATPVPPACSVRPRSVHVETWPAPIVAVGLGRFKEAVGAKACQ
ncbi:hypothetical protein [Phenylobacterium sp.]|uniref:hypothetical protein n=1 Tax=Phenylobacterium sp. TaxID=1871053 RepID=UPI0028126799|nr:hypothetical protein [Phenylobacterium sp.]